MITEISFVEIKNIWEKFLWAERKSQIEEHSAMLFLSGFDLKNYKNKPTHFGYIINDKIVGVNSGHLCCDNSYRSRGLYVLSDHRGKKIGVELLKATISQGIKENSKFIWSLPRQSSWTTYKSAGFYLASEWQETETSINAYCRKDV